MVVVVYLPDGIAPDRNIGITYDGLAVEPVLDN